MPKMAKHPGLTLHTFPGHNRRGRRKTALCEGFNAKPRIANIFFGKNPTHKNLFSPEKVIALKVDPKKFFCPFPSEHKKNRFHNINKRILFETRKFVKRKKLENPAEKNKTKLLLRLPTSSFGASQLMKRKISHFWKRR